MLHALETGGEPCAQTALESLLAEATTGAKADAARHGHVQFVGAGPGDPELLTLKARSALDKADVVIYDRLASPEIMELARREAELIAVGKTLGGPSWQQDDINTLLVEQAAKGQQVVRLKSGDPGVYGRLDEEITALAEAGIGYSIVPGITAASAAAASAGFSLTRRGRNKALRFLTAHDTDGFAEHDWHGLALPGTAAAIYMGVRAATFLQGRLLMHGGDPATPMTVVENASRAEQKIVTATLGSLTARMRAEGVISPAVIFLGLSAAAATPALPGQQSLISPNSTAHNSAALAAGA